MRFAVPAVLLIACVHIHTERQVGEWVRPDASPGTTIESGEFSYYEDQLADERHARSIALMMEDCALYGARLGPAFITKEWMTDGRPPRHHVRYQCGTPDAGGAELDAGVAQ